MGEREGGGSAKQKRPGGYGGSRRREKAVRGVKSVKGMQRVKSDEREESLGMSWGSQTLRAEEGE